MVKILAEARITSFYPQILADWAVFYGHECTNLGALIRVFVVKCVVLVEICDRSIGEPQCGRDFRGNMFLWPRMHKSRRFNSCIRG